MAHSSRKIRNFAILLIFLTFSLIPGVVGAGPQARAVELKLPCPGLPCCGLPCGRGFSESMAKHDLILTGFWD